MTQHCCCFPVATTVLTGESSDPEQRCHCQHPQCWSIFARDQRIAFSGVDSSVATTTSSTRSAVTVAGQPGRGSGCRDRDAGGG